MQGVWLKKILNKLLNCNGNLFGFCQLRVITFMAGQALNCLLVASFIPDDFYLFVHAMLLNSVSACLTVKMPGFCTPISLLGFL